MPAPAGIKGLRIGVKMMGDIARYAQFETPQALELACVHMHETVGCSGQMAQAILAPSARPKASAGTVRYCMECGKAIPEGARFCPGCGRAQ